MKPAAFVLLVACASPPPLGAPADAAAPDTATDATQLDAAPAPDAAPEFPEPPVLPWCFERHEVDPLGVTVSVVTLCEPGRADTSIGIDVFADGEGGLFGSLWRGAGCGEVARVRFPFVPPPPAGAPPPGVFVFPLGDAFGTPIRCQDL